MIKNSRGITLVSLVITIAVMIIIASITVSTSMDRFEINNLNKMINDIEFLEQKVSNYYLKYNSIPVVKDDNNKEPILYDYTLLEFNKNINDNANYYIIDLKYMNDIALNYGREGFESINSSDDVYIINEKSHQIYYVRGIELNGEYYHSILDNNNTSDNIPPSTPQIKIISGEKYTEDNGEDIYTTEVEIEIIPGKDNWSGIDETTYYYTFKDIYNNESTIDETKITEKNIIELTEEGKYNIRVKTYDKSGNYSENNIEIEILLPNQEDEIIDNNVLENELDINEMQ